MIQRWISKQQMLNATVHWNHDRDRVSNRTTLRRPVHPNKNLRLRTLSNFGCAFRGWRRRLTTLGRRPHRMRFEERLQSPFYQALVCIRYNDFH